MKELLKAKSEFRKKGIVLIADKTKSGAGGSWRFASEDNLVKTIQKPLSECGLEVIPTMVGTSVKVTLWHIESGDFIDSSIDLAEVIPRKDKNGNAMYLDAEIERGKQFGYWSRTLTIRLLGLSDIDAEDTMNFPQDISDDTKDMRVELKALVDSSTDSEATNKWIFKNYSVPSIEALNSDNLKHVINLLKQKAK